MWGKRLVMAAAVLASAPVQGATLESSVGLDASIAYDDNFLHQADGVATPAGSSREDLTSSTTLSAGAKLDLGRETLYLDGSAGLLRHLNNSRFDTEVYSISGGGSWKGDRCGADVSLSASRSPIELDDVVGVVSGDKSTYGVSASGNCAVGAHYSAGLSTDYAIIRTETDSALVSDGNHLGAKGHFSYTLDPLSHVGLSVGYQQWVSDAVEASQPDQSETRLVDVGISGKYRLGPKLTLSAQAALAHVFDALGDDLTTYVADARLDWQATPKVSVHLGVSRSINSSVEIASSYVVSEAAQLSANWTATPDIGVSAWLRYGSQSYSGSDQLESLSSDFERTLLSTGVQASYKVNDHVSVKLAYSFKDSNSSLAAGDYTANQVLLGLGLTY